MPDTHATESPVIEPDPPVITLGCDVDSENRPRRRRPIILGALLALTLAGGATAGTAGWRVIAQKDASLNTPDEVVGLVRDDSHQARLTADHLRDVVAAHIQLDQNLGVVYADPEDAARSVLLFGGTALFWQPEKELDRLLALAGGESEAVDDVREVPAGELGGIMKCGVSRDTDGDMAVCGWADHGSIVLAMFPNRGIEESGALLRDIRPAIQSRD